jgi:hypothetical protein
VDRDLIIRGAGFDRTAVDGGGTGDDGRGVFLIEGGHVTQVTLADMTIRNGHASYIAGGVAHLDGRLHIESCVIRDNSASSKGTVQAYGGGVFSVGDIKISNSVITGNRVPGWGYGGGIAVSNWWHDSPAPMVEIESTTIADNHAASYGGGLALGGGWLDTTVRDSTIVANSAGACAGADLSGLVSISRTAVADNATLWGDGDEVCPAAAIDRESAGGTTLVVVEPFEVLESFVSSGDSVLGGKRHYSSFVLRRGDRLIAEPRRPLTIVARRIVIDGTIDASGTGHRGNGGRVSLVGAEVTIAGEVLADGFLRGPRGGDGGAVLVSGLDVVVTGHCSARGGNGGAPGRIEVLYRDTLDDRGVLSVGFDSWPITRDDGHGSIRIERKRHLFELMPVLRER